MCLGIPGKILEIFDREGIRMGKVDFNGIEMDACLEAVPEAEAGSYVIVHAGFAISSLSEEEAKETLDILEQMDVFAQEEDQQTDNV
jgi:hydrogenase expression/formation protein HypC